MPKEHPANLSINALGLDDTVYLVQVAATLPIYERMATGVLVYVQHADAINAAARCDGHVVSVLLRQAVEYALAQHTGCIFLFAPNRPLGLAFIPTQQPTLVADAAAMAALPWARAPFN